MSFITRSASRLIGVSSLQNFSKNIGAACIFSHSQRSIPLSRTLVVLSTPSRMNSNKQQKHSSLCSCGCGIHGMHTKGDKELVEFLREEISGEKKNEAQVPTSLDEFSIKKDKAELTLTKKFNDETITVSLNVNHTVGTDPSVAEDEGKLSSKPDFEVDVKIGSKTFSLSCQHTAPEDLVEGDQVEDKFGISELTFFEGEWEDKTYCVSGDILDGVMYDLLMNYLDERGINNEFIEKLGNLCSTYEHTLYVNMLQNIEKFVTRK